MKTLVFSMLTVCIIISCSKHEAGLIIRNQLNQERKDAPVVVSRKDVVELTGDNLKNQAPVLLDKKGNYIPSQLDDLDGDGTWDELAFVCDLDANETKNLQIKLVDYSQIPKFRMRTNVRLGVGSVQEGFKGVDQAFSPKGYTGVPVMYQAESISWENDLMGFRNYFDCRNAKDLFGKLSPEMVMDHIGTKESGSYHKLSDWGMDVLHVGPSLGAGGLAVFQNDSLYRLGSTESFEFKLITKGPVRSVFELNFTGWNVDGKKLQAQEKISIWAGKYWFRSDVTIKGFEQEKELAIGIVTSHLKENKPFSFVANKGYVAVATHGIQSMNEDYLGMGILLKSEEKIRQGDVPALPEKISKGNRYNQAVGETHFVTQKITSNQPATHYFFAVWEKEDKVWSDQQKFEGLIKKEAERLSSPVVILRK